MKLSMSQDESKFILNFDYHPGYVSALHSIPGARWNKTGRFWVIPKDIGTLKALRGYFPWVKIESNIEDWEKFIIKKERENLRAKKNDDIEASVQNLDYKLKPFPYQMKAISLLTRNESFALTMEMGTGKTACAINAMRIFKANGVMKRALVVCPLSVVSVWINELEKHSDLKGVKLVGSLYERRKAFREEADVYVINYEGMRIFKDDLVCYEWDVMICDESQKIKNRKSMQAKSCYAVGRLAARRYILSGTLIVNNPLDLFGQFKFMNNCILGDNYYGYANRYAMFVTNGRARFPVKFQNLDELSSRIAPWMYRITKKDAGLDLPDKVYQIRYVSMNDKSMRLYKSLSRELSAFLESGETITAPIVLTKLLRFSQITAGFITTESGNIEELGNEKIRELEAILEQTEGQVVVWCKFRHEMEMVSRHLDRLDIKHGCLSGSTSQAEREDIIGRFSNNELKVFVGQIEAGGTGINLMTASTCVYMSNSYSLGSRLQSEDRLHRIGQKNAVNYIDIIASGTIDEKVLDLLRSKKNLADIINGDNLSVIHELIGGQND